MPSCCETSDLKNAPRDGLTIALAGNPNSGKTTLFNALTGLKQKVANYPGVTVEKKTGTCKLPDGSRVNIIDLPGTYSLISRSPDELIAMQVLRGLRPDVPPIDVVIVVVDASNLQRNLYLVSQLIELGRPLVVALNMMDVAERRGLHVSADRLSHQLGVPVVSIVGHKKQGVKELKSAIAKATVAPMPNWDLPQEMRDELALVAGALGIQLSESSIKPTSTYPALAERLLINDHATDLAPVAKQDPVRSLLGSATSRLNQFGIDPIQADIEAHYQWIDQVTAASLIPACERISNSVLSPQSSVLDYAPKPTFTEKLDRLLIHKIWGLAIFALIMGTLFVTIFWAAAPIMDALQSAVTSLGTLAVSHLSDGPLRDLVKDGIFKGVGAVLVFVPQIALLFMFLSILEDSGYLARAAFLMDRLLSKVGLQGKSFIPLLSSFACAIPGVLATRTIENRKERLATILVLPFMSCSARLPVYTLLIGTFFASYGPLRQAGIMLALYALGIVAAAGTAFIFKRTLMRGPATTFILELPTYKLPQLSQVARQVWTNSKEFVTKAGTTIFCLSVILWALMYYPRMSESRATQVADAWKPTYANIEAALTPPPPPLPTPNPRNLRQIGQTPMALVNESIAHFTRQDASKLDFAEFTGTILKGELRPDEQTRLDEIRKTETEKSVAGAQLRYSFAGRFGHLIEPTIKPLGYDWKMGVGLVGAFAAREVFVSTMGIVYSVGEIDDQTTPLADAMRADRYANGAPVWTPVVAVSLLVWFVLAMQCMSTLAIVRRETGNWRWPIFMLVYMNVLAYVVALLVYQVGTRLFA